MSRSEWPNAGQTESVSEIGKSFSVSSETPQRSWNLYPLQYLPRRNCPIDAVEAAGRFVPGRPESGCRRPGAAGRTSGVLKPFVVHQLRNTLKVPQVLPNTLP